MKGLDSRLRAILDNINEVNIMADIGCDHGKISVYALLEKRAKRVIAVDISPKSLKKTKELGENYGVSRKIKLLEGDGFAPIDEKIDLAVIAGMGGREIVKVLKEGGYYGDCVLVPHQDAEVLREFLSGKVDIIKDYIARSAGKFYSIIVTQKGSYSYLADELLYGKNQPESSDYTKMLFERKKRLEYILSQNTPPQDSRIIKEWGILCKLLKKEEDSYA